MKSRSDLYHGVGLLAVVVGLVGWMLLHLPTFEAPGMLPGAWLKIGTIFACIFGSAVLFFLAGLLWEKRWPTPVRVNPPKDQS